MGFSILHEKKDMEGVVEILNKIYEVRGVRVMLDFDLAALYQVKTRVLNQAVKRNHERFPGDFMFQLSYEEWKGMSSLLGTYSQLIFNCL